MAGNNIIIPMETELREQADALFAELGMDLPTAIGIFVRQALREGGFPFQVSLQKADPAGNPHRMPNPEAGRRARVPADRDLQEIDALFADVHTPD